MEDLENNVILEENYICKSISGEEDENGNYKFEVEASNENLDLQNQITLQSALKKSEEYFVTNGVISDDHLHKTRNPDGSVETHKEKIIGEPISVRFDPATKKTFVKGILYSGIEAAKPYIELLKNKSRLVKASIGGIMPKIRKNADGSETVTSFMWNDLALTCSPVNWTVGSAKFAKSMGIIDFCKSLNAGYGTDSSMFEGGRVLQGEDLEKKTIKIQDLTEDGDLAGEEEKDDFEKGKESDEEMEIIKSTIIAIENGKLLSKSAIERYLNDCGFDVDKAREVTLEIIEQGGNKMNKSHFSSQIDELLKSFKGDEPEDDKKKKKMDSEDEETQDTLFDDDNISEDDDVEKCGVKKSFEEDDYLDATELIKSLSATVDELKERNESLEKSLEEIQNNMIQVTKSFGDYLKLPNEKVSVVEKSLGKNDVSIAGPSEKPTKADFDVLKSALSKACSKGAISLEEVTFYSSEFQKSMKGQKINPEVWQKTCAIVKENR